MLVRCYEWVDYDDDAFYGVRRDFWSFIKVKFLEFINLSGPGSLSDHLSFRLLWCSATKVLLYHGLTICSSGTPLLTLYHSPSALCQEAFLTLKFPVLVQLPDRDCIIVGYQSFLRIRAITNKLMYIRLLPNTCIWRVIYNATKVH